MSFGYTVLGFGSSATHAATVSAPSAMTINDDDGTAASMTVQMYDGSNRTVGSATDVAHGDTSTFNNFNPSGAGIAAMAIYADSGSSGTAPTSFAWAISLPTNESSLLFSTGANTINLTSEDIGTTTVVLNFGSGSITSGDEVIFQAICTGTNAGGSTASPTYQFTITFA